MTRAATQEERWDRERDYRKHEPRPSDPIPLRLQPVVPGAMEVAILVKGISDYTAAANLIEQYAQTVAAEAKLQAVIDTGDRILATFEREGA